jgi:glucose/arabinose dehydrogenase
VAAFSIVLSCSQSGTEKPLNSVASDVPEDPPEDVPEIPADPTDTSPVTGLATVAVAAGLSQPLLVCSPAGDNNRLFVVEKGGRIKILRDGAVMTTLYLDITDRVGTGAGEQGLLGMAFDPDYDINGFFYVNYINASGNTVIARFEVSSDADIADPLSEQIILRVEQPFSNHNAGMLAFSPLDGFLYIGLGDGGSAGDPDNHGQNPLSLLGKMLRIDVRNDLPYTVPADNPYRDNQDTLSEIWSFGLRNPWRYSFDRATGDIYIGDVGQNLIEEINISLASSNGGENYGWRLKEGSHCFNPTQNCSDGLALTDPVFEYSHSDPGSPCSVTGGYVYRGAVLPGFTGTYFFGDFCSGQVWSFRYTNNAVTDFKDRTEELALPQPSIASFGEDGAGELYIVDLGGTIYKIVAN